MTPFHTAVSVLVAAAAMSAPAGAQPFLPGPPNQLATPARLADELAILRIPTEIEVAVDRKDWPRARSFFADEVRVDFGTLGDGRPAVVKADALISAWAANLGPRKQSFHQRGHALVSVNGDRATAYSQGYAWNKMEGNGEPLWEVWGNYTHELVWTPDGWRVVGLTLEVTHERGNTWVKATPGSG